MIMESRAQGQTSQEMFSGHLFVFHAFDVGEDIDLNAIEANPDIIKSQLNLPKYFKNYQKPVCIEFPGQQKSICASVKINNFGAISLTYKIPFHDTLTNLLKEIPIVKGKLVQQSTNDANEVFNLLKKYTTQAKFYQTSSSYTVIQLNTHDTTLSAADLKRTYGGAIASLLRFEDESLSEYQKNEILESALGYYRGDLIIIDTEAAFIYDEEYQEVLYLFEFGNIQQLELQYFDRQLTRQLNIIYERKVKPLPWRTYLPLSWAEGDPVSELGRLKVDISVITEQLDSSIKLAGEPYFSEIYKLLIENLDLANWRDAIERKLEIIKDTRTVYQAKIETQRSEILSIAITVLIFIELIVAFIK
jgi:hypothetical protein